MNPRVRTVRCEANHRLHLTFDNGEQRIFDCTGLLDFGVFSELKDTQYFGRARVMDGTVVWPNEQDICPDTLYLDSAPVSAALA